MPGETCSGCGAPLVHDPRQTDQRESGVLIHHYRCPSCEDGGSVVTSDGEVTQRHGVCDPAYQRSPAAGRAVADGGEPQ
jgi:hypothetical protein